MKFNSGDIVIISSKYSTFEGYAARVRRSDQFNRRHLYTVDFLCRDHSAVYWGEELRHCTPLDEVLE